MTARALVSVIVCSFNRSADLRLSLEAIFASTHRPLEVIVVDNASTDDAVAVAASFPEVRLLRNADNKGFAEANDQALELSNGSYVALVNNDAVLEPTWIASLVDLLEDTPEAAAAGSKCWFWNDENP
ncbi:MAG: glycosyltransferase, partial [Polyangiales bacterium]